MKGEQSTRNTATQSQLKAAKKKTKQQQIEWRKKKSHLMYDYY